MTPEEIANIEKENDDLIKLWKECLSKEELRVRLQTTSDQLEAKVLALQVEVAGLQALLWFMDHYDTSPQEAIRMVRNKTTRTPEEAQSLQAWDQFMLQWSRMGSALL
jgi:hypothetical protein